MGKTNNAMTGRKAQFLNLQEDGIKLRAVTFKSKRAYDRNASKNWKRDE